MRRKTPPPKIKPPEGPENGVLPDGVKPEVMETQFPARRILSLVGDKWFTIVLYYLSTRDVRRFNELQRQIPDISRKMLIQTLRGMERDGLLERTVYHQVPPKTEYRLTSDGHRLREPIAWLCEWASENSDFLEAIGIRRSSRPVE